MKPDLIKSDYHSKEEYDAYIYGSADVVGTYVPKSFVAGDDRNVIKLKDEAMRLVLLPESEFFTI
jgi:phytoene/squalene synthetase